MERYIINIAQIFDARINLKNGSPACYYSLQTSAFPQDVSSLLGISLHKLGFSNRANIGPLNSVEFGTRFITVDNDKQIKLQIWDTVSY